jgi:hypothetical protein
MPQEYRARPFPWKLVLASIPILVLFGCKSTTSTTDVGWEVKADVRVVSVTPPGGEVDANFNPATIKVKKKRQIVVWVLEGEGSLQIHFANNPFPEQPVCDGRFCFALKPPAADKPTGLYPYTATVTAGGQTTSADPNVEVED